MRRRPHVAPRKAFLVGVEGRSDEAFVAFLQRLCDRERLHVHLRALPAGGGSARVVVENTARAVGRLPRRQFADRIVLLDEDRVEQDRRERQEASNAARRHGLRLVYFRPNLEGLLVRLHAGRERSGVTAGQALQELQRLWRGYTKSLTADELTRRFTPIDLKRAARHDDQLRTLLRIVGVMS